MRKLLVLLLVSFTVLAQAQKGKVIAAATALSQSQIKEAQEYITQAFESEEVAKIPKAWLVKGQVYVEIYKLQMEELLKAPNSLATAKEAFQKAYELDKVAEKKPGKYKMDIGEGMYTVARGTFESAVTDFNSSEFKRAMDKFNSSAEVIDYILEKDIIDGSLKEEAATLKEDAFKNGALCALNAQDYDGAVEFYKEIQAMGKADDKLYANLSAIYISQGKFDEAKATIEAGRAEYPDNESLVESELNYYIGTDQADKAIDKLLDAIKTKPDNADLKFNLALAYGKMEDEDKMVATYEEIIAMDPTYHAAYLNLGAHFNEKANAVIEEINKVSESDWKAAVAMEPKRDEWYNKALPHLEKAYELDKSDPNVIRVLNRIYANMNLMDKMIK